MQQESYYLPLANGIDTLHIRRIWQQDQGVPVLMLHGAMGDGRIFYSSSGKGLAPWLARQGYDVFIPDFRGRGKSTPAIHRESDFGLKEMQEEDMPAVAAFIEKIKGPVRQHWMAHSWGGVTVFSYLAKQLESTRIHSIVLFACKRRISVQNLKKFWMINFGWGFIGRLSVARHGYLDAKKLKFGSDNESRRSNWEMYTWARKKQWIDWYDGFDYSAALHALNLPPILSLTGKGDHYLGHRKDAQLLLEETGSDNYEFKVLSQANGNLRDYGHVDILTAPEAEADHFPGVLDWLKQQEADK